jgi:hypothetical protein
MLAPLALIPALALLAPGSLTLPRPSDPFKAIVPCEVVVHVTQSWVSTWDHDGDLRHDRLEVTTAAGRKHQFDLTRYVDAFVIGADGWTYHLYCFAGRDGNHPTWVIPNRLIHNVVLASPFRWDASDGTIYELRIADWGPDGMTGWVSRWPAGR